MEQQEPPVEPPKTLWMHAALVYQRIFAAHTVSFYLVFAVLIAALLGTQVVFFQDDPKRFGLVLILQFIFFFIVIYRAIVDIAEIIRGHFSEKEEVYRSTIGDKEFAEQLGKGVAERRGES
jgi:hypothetical protein